MSPEWTKQGTHGLTNTEVVSTWPARVSARSSAYALWLLAWWFIGLLTVGAGEIFTFLSAPRIPFFLLGCFALVLSALVWGLLPCLIVCYFDYLVVGSWRLILFWRGTEGNESGRAGEEGSCRSKGRGKCGQDELYEKNVFSIKRMNQVKHMK